MIVGNNQSPILVTLLLDRRQLRGEKSGPIVRAQQYRNARGLALGG